LKNFKTVAKSLFMTDKKQISFRLSKELNDWIKNEIKAGNFESMSQAVEQALVHLQERIDEKQ
jgi:Arc/MetJ-type ribon-helix-helix transcriptional regulator